MTLSDTTGIVLASVVASILTVVSVYAFGCWVAAVDGRWSSGRDVKHRWVLVVGPLVWFAALIVGAALVAGRVL